MNKENKKQTSEKNAKDSVTSAPESGEPKRGGRADDNPDRRASTTVDESGKTGAAGGRKK